MHETPTTVVIFVRDVNDLPPIFDQGSYTTTISEEYVAKRPLMQVHKYPFFHFVFHLLQVLFVTCLLSLRNTPHYN